MLNRDDLARKIGTKLKLLRKASGLTQKKLAESTGLSMGLLSRIENGLAFPSIPTLQLISDALKSDIGYFFQGEEDKGYVVTKPGERRVVVSKSGPKGIIAYELELLAEGMQNPFMEPAIVSHVGKNGDVEARTHDGQEFIYVLEGEIKLTLGSDEFLLTRGNAAYWNGSVPHKGVKMGRVPARAVHVHLIPGRWTGTFQHDDRDAPEKSRVRTKQRRNTGRKERG